MDINQCSIADKCYLSKFTITQFKNTVVRTSDTLINLRQRWNRSCSRPVQTRMPVPVRRPVRDPGPLAVTSTITCSPNNVIVSLIAPPREHHLYTEYHIFEPNFVILGDKVVRFQTTFPRTLLSTARDKRGSRRALSQSPQHIVSMYMTTRTVCASVDYHSH